MGFGPNRIVFEIRRAKRGDVPLLDEQGQIEYDKTGNMLFEALRDENGNILYYDETEILESNNLSCNAGLEAAKDRLFNSGTSETTAHFIALSCSTDTPLATWTEIPAEITTGGLARAAATYNSGGTGICDLSKAFTASATHTDVQLIGLLNAAAAGDLYFAGTITPATLISGDQLTAKWDPITLS